MRPPTRIYIPALDGMRALAFLLVFLAHSMPERDLPGGFGVAVFFFLSGYLITSLLRAEAHDAGRISLKNFYLRRVLRIFPPCYLTVIAVSTLAALGVIYNTESYKSLVAAFLYWSNYWNILGYGNLPAGLGVLWSLAVEEHYYLIFPLLYATLLRRRASRATQAGCLLGLCTLALAWRCYRAYAMHSPWANIYEGTDTRFDTILFGCLLAIVANPHLGDRVDWLRRHALALALAGLGLLVFTFAYRNAFFRDTVRYTLQAVAFFPIFFLIILPGKNPLTRVLEWRVLRWLGYLSYSMYLIHHTLFQHVYHFYGTSVLTAGVVLALTIGYAQAMRSLVELPIQKWRARLGSQTPTPLATVTELPTQSDAARKTKAG